MISIRINTIQASRKDVLSVLAGAGLEYEEVRWYENALVVKCDDTRVLTSLDAYENGWFYIQNLSSMLTALVLESAAGETVLDMCAAPGGKTVQMADMMGNIGSILANDVSKTRMFTMKDLLARNGVDNTEVSLGKGEWLWRKYANSFDKVLLDAPCSMDQDLSPKKIKDLARQQTYLIRSAFACLKPGGGLVYSTCTSTREENEDVVEWLARKEEGVEIEKISVGGLEDYQTKEGYMRIPQGEIFDSFFVAKIRKLL